MSRPGMHTMIAQLDAGYANLCRVQLAGDYLSIPGMNGCVIAGATAAERIQAAVPAMPD
jgi:protoporphyrinogen oxidase